MSLPRQSPPKDSLQQLLGPLLSLDPSEVLNGLDPSLPGLDETLQWEEDGVPIWWPKHRPPDQGPPWSPSERRRVLLRNLREQLPPDFPPKPATTGERPVLVDTLRHIYDGLRSGAQDILASL